MNCKRCGSLLNPSDLFCKGCGATVSGSVGEPDSQSLINNTQPTMETANTNAEIKDFGFQGTSNISQKTEILDVNSIKQAENRMGPTNDFQQPNTNQNFYNGQVPFNTNVNSQISNYESASHNYEAEVKGNKTNPLLLIIGVLLIVALAIGATLYFTGSFNKSEDKDAVANVEKYKVNYQGYTLSIPANLVYEAKNDELYLGDEAGTWYLELAVIDGSYSTLLSKKNQLKSSAEGQGYTASDVVEKNIGSKNFVIMEMGYQGTNSLLGYTRASATQLFILGGYTKANDFDYSLFETVAPILSDAVYNGESNSIKGGAFDIDDFADIANK